MLRVYKFVQMRHFLLISFQKVPRHLLQRDEGWGHFYDASFTCFQDELNRSEQFEVRMFQMSSDKKLLNTEPLGVGTRPCKF